MPPRKCSNLHDAADTAEQRRTLITLDTHPCTSNKTRNRHRRAIVRLHDCREKKKKREKRRGEAILETAMQERRRRCFGNGPRVLAAAVLGSFVLDTTAFAWSPLAGKTFSSKAHSPFCRSVCVTLSCRVALKSERRKGALTYDEMAHDSN